MAASIRPSRCKSLQQNKKRESRTDPGHSVVHGARAGMSWQSYGRGLRVYYVGQRTYFASAVVQTAHRKVSKLVRPSLSAWEKRQGANLGLATFAMEASSGPPIDFVKPLQSECPLLSPKAAKLPLRPPSALRAFSCGTSRVVLFDGKEKNASTLNPFPYYFGVLRGAFSVAGANAQHMCIMQIRNLLHSHHVSFRQRSMNVAVLALPQSPRRRFRSQGLRSLLFATQRQCMRLGCSCESLDEFQLSLFVENVVG